MEGKTGYQRFRTRSRRYVVYHRLDADPNLVHPAGGGDWFFMPTDGVGADKVWSLGFLTSDEALTAAEEEEARRPFEDAATELRLEEEQTESP